jgi:hypothetical protein
MEPLGCRVEALHARDQTEVSVVRQWHSIHTYHRPLQATQYCIGDQFCRNKNKTQVGTASDGRLAWLVGLAVSSDPLLPRVRYYVIWLSASATGFYPHLRPPRPFLDPRTTVSPPPPPPPPPSQHLLLHRSAHVCFRCSLLQLP